VSSGPDLKIEISVDPSLYSTAAVLRAAHRFTASHYVEIVQRPEGTLVIVTPRQAGSLSPTFREEFLTTLIDEALREQIAQETKGIRELLVGMAFGRALPNDDGRTVQE